MRHPLPFVAINYDGDSVVGFHAKREEAELEAEEFAGENPGRVYAVAELKTMFVTSTPTVERTEVKP